MPLRGLRRVALGMVGAVMFASGANAGSPWLSFDAPGSWLTQAYAINGHNLIVGQCQNPATFWSCGFLRTKDGTLTIFDAPDANQGTTAIGVNDAGDITGSFVFFTDLQYTQSYVRHPDGTFEEFAVNGLRWTVAAAINDQGTVIGYAQGNRTSPKAFLRKADGKSEIFLRNTDGSYAKSINRRGAITGCYMRDGLMHGFVRGTAGKITTFDPPGSINTQPASINDKGEITGLYTGEDYFNHGFLREPDGTITTFDAPNAASQGTLPMAIGPDGDIAGIFYDDANNYHGFVRDRAGTIHRIDVPGQFSTAILGISPTGKVVGYDVEGHAVRGYQRVWRRN